MSLSDFLLAFALPALPVLVAVLLFVPATARPARYLAPWLPLTALGILPLYGRVVELPWLLLGTRIGLDDTALPLFLLAVTAWTLAGLHAARNLSEERRDDPGNTGVRSGFLFFWLMTWTGNLCVFITLDAASFYAAFATMTFSAYGLVIHYRRPGDFRAGRVYMTMAVLGEGMIIAALLTLGSSFGNVPLERAGEFVGLLPQGSWVGVLLVLGFGVKMGLVPLHMWLPLAHPRAPVGASAVLSGVIVKGGLMGWLRFLPLGFDTGTAAGMMLLAGGLVTAFYGVLAGLAQTRAKTVLAYSTVSQMGLLAAVIGLALLYPEQAPVLAAVAGIFALHHGLAKAALFLSVDVAGSAPRLGRALMWLPALAVSGAPLTSGALAKVLVKTGLPEAEAGWLDPVLYASSIATTLLMARFLFINWPRQPVAPGGTALPWTLMVAASATLPWLYALLAEPAWAARPFGPSYLMGTAGPVALGALAAVTGARLLRGRRLPPVPEGDLIALFGFRLPRRIPVPPRPAYRGSATGALLERMEGRLTEVAVALLAWLALLSLLFLAGASW